MQVLVRRPCGWRRDAGRPQLRTLPLPPIPPNLRIPLRLYTHLLLSPSIHQSTTQQGATADACICTPSLRVHPEGQGAALVGRGLQHSSTECVHSALVLGYWNMMTGSRVGDGGGEAGGDAWPISRRAYHHHAVLSRLDSFPATSAHTAKRVSQLRQRTVKSRPLIDIDSHHHIEPPANDAPSTQRTVYSKNALVDKVRATVLRATGGVQRCGSCSI